MGFLRCSNSFLAELWSNSSSTHRYCVVKTSAEYERILCICCLYYFTYHGLTLTIAPLLKNTSANEGKKDIKGEYKVVLPMCSWVQFSAGAVYCTLLQMFWGASDGLFISFNVVTLKGWIAVVKVMDYGVFTHVAQTQKALKRTPGTAAGGTGKMISPTVPILLWPSFKNLTPKVLLLTNQFNLQPQ